MGLALRDRQSATSETARSINRQLVLNLVRRQERISRADLARVSGLQRSTVSAIVEQLIEDQWVAEGETGHTARGRRPTYVSLHERRAILAIDIRPIHSTIAISDSMPA